MTAVAFLVLSVVALGAAGRRASTASRRSGVATRLPQSTAADRGVRRLRPPPPPAWLGAALADAAVDVAPGTVWVGWLAALAVIGCGAGLVAGPAAAALAAMAVGGVPPLVLRSNRGRADSRVEKELPLALESIARSLRSGASVRQAIGETAAGAAARGPGPGRARGPGPLPTELALVADQAAHGGGLVEALECLAARRPSRGVRLAVAALCLGVDTGGAQARAVDGVAATMRERLAVEAEVRALSSQARMSALVIGLAPLGFGAFAAATDPRTSQFLLHTPMGLALVGAGLVLDGAGWLWMQRLCRVDA